MDVNLNNWKNNIKKLILRNDLMLLFLRISQHRMIDHYLPKFVRSIESLSKEQLWMKESENLNSIGGITLHVCEHVSRHIVRFSQPHTLFDKGIEDHFPDLDIEPSALSLSVQQIFTDWHTKLKERLEDVKKQENDKITDAVLHQHFDMHSIYHLVEHSGYHLGQIVDRTQRITERSFQFCQNGINEKNLIRKLEE